MTQEQHDNAVLEMVRKLPNWQAGWSDPCQADWLRAANVIKNLLVEIKPEKKDVPHEA